jgi:hypothetical protein
MATLAEKIHQKINVGALSCQRPEKVLAGHGDGSPCSACGLPIQPDQIEWSFWTGDVLTHRFHLGCHGLWQSECRNRSWQGSA